MNNTTIFGLNDSIHDASMILIPVPWDLTASFRKGTATGAENIRQTSSQIDLYTPHNQGFYKQGITMLPHPQDIFHLNKKYTSDSQWIMEHDNTSSSMHQKKLSAINLASQTMQNWLKTTVLEYLNQNKLIGIVGGDHSLSEASLSAIAKKHDSFSILHCDAHMDLREKYQGFSHSHASVMRQSLKIHQIQSLVQVGVRDFSEEELAFASHNPRIHTFDQFHINKELYNGKSWDSLCKTIIEPLVQDIYISVDIDVLDPALCPHTGTPVPGGLDYNQLIHLISTCINYKKNIIGFDLVEVSGAANSIDTITACHLLYALSAALAT
tara:strand:+ start:1403 stop:2377 length:975 start_codon:yes stop_codon:yes gene_type:complete